VKNNEKLILQIERLLSTIKHEFLCKTEVEIEDSSIWVKAIFKPNLKEIDPHKRLFMRVAVREEIELLLKKYLDINVNVATLESDDCI